MIYESPKDMVKYRSTWDLCNIIFITFLQHSTIVYTYILLLMKMFIGGF